MNVHLGGWTIFDTRLMPFRVPKLETLENIMPNWRQHSGVNLREKKYASRWGFTIAIFRDGIITADVWQKLRFPIQGWIFANKSMLPAGVLPSSFFGMALSLQTCDKSCSGTLGGEKKWRFRWGPVNICNLDGIIPADVWQKLLSHPGGWNEIVLFTGDQRHFANEFALWLRSETHVPFSPPQMWKQLLSHVCRNNANSFLKCHWSAAKRMIPFQVPNRDIYFCHTSAGIMPSRLQMFTGPQRNAYLFVDKSGGELLLL